MWSSIRREITARTSSHLSHPSEFDTMSSSTWRPRTRVREARSRWDAPKKRQTKAYVLLYIGYSTPFPARRRTTCLPPVLHMIYMCDHSGNRDKKSTPKPGQNRILVTITRKSGPQREFPCKPMKVTSLRGVSELL